LVFIQYQCVRDLSDIIFFQYKRGTKTKNSNRILSSIKESNGDLPESSNVTSEPCKDVKVNVYKL
jgi:hypothetical protein